MLYNLNSTFQTHDIDFQNIATAVLIIDMQKQYLDPKFSSYIPNTKSLPSALNQIRNKIKLQVGENNYIEIFTIDCLMKNSLCLLESEEILLSEELITKKDFDTIKRVTIHPTIDDGENEMKALKKLIPDVLERKLFILEKANEKAEYSAFGETWDAQNKYGRGKTSSIAHKILKARGIKRVYVVGLAYQQCVLFTAADAAYLGYETIMVENGSNSSVLTVDQTGTKIRDELLSNSQKYETDRVFYLIANKFNGLPGRNNEDLKIVKFDGTNFNILTSTKK